MVEMHDDTATRAPGPRRRPRRPGCTFCLALVAGLGAELAAFVLFETTVPGGFSGNTSPGAVCILAPALAATWGLLRSFRRGSRTIGA